MKRIVAVVAALGLVAGACGGDDDDAGSDADATAATPAEESSAEDTSDGDTSDGDTSAATDDDPPEATDDGADDGADDGDDDGADDGGDDGGGIDAGPIRSIDDVPEECREQMADFLREIEPIVSDVDWQSATFAEFEQIGEEFQAISDDFEARNTVVGCDRLDFVDDNEFELMLEFADDVAPGSVGFLEFISAFDGIGSDADIDDGTGDDGSADETGFADCDEAIVFVQDLVDNYDSFAEVPASELLRFSGLAAVFGTCTPEQLEFLNSPEVSAFLEG